MPFVKSAAAAAAALLLAGPAAAVTLTNFDFEAPVAPYSLPPGWNGSTAALGGPLNAPNLFVAAGADYIPCCGVSGSAAALANHFATFGAGDSPHAGGILAQSFATGAGVTYAYGFDAAAFGIAGTQTLRVRITDLVTNTLLSLNDVTVGSNNDLDTAFSHHGFAFTAASALSQIRFENISATTLNIDAAVDNVTVIPRAVVDSVVPEPASWVCLVAGFASLGAALRRRQAAAGLLLR